MAEEVHIKDVEPTLEAPTVETVATPRAKRKRRAGKSALRQLKGLAKHQATIKRLNAALEADTPTLDRSSTFYMPDSVCGSRAAPLRFITAAAKMLLLWFDDPEVERDYR